MERDPIATEVRALASAVGLAGFEAESPQPEILASLRKMGLIAEGEGGAATTHDAALGAAPAPATTPISDRAACTVGTALDSFLLTIQHHRAGAELSEAVRSEARRLRAALHDRERGLKESRRR